ncbi:MAG: molybdopterin-dependent oxidoreductase [Ferruginibacter sp.]|nr:molybdopterin-dependent oxidoreductase [Ferruginibacter sp.]
MIATEKDITPAQWKRRSVLSFAVFILFLLLCFAGWNWLKKQPTEAGAIKPLRTVLNTNENIFYSLFNPGRLAQTYPKQFAVPRVRVNGDAGLGTDFDASTWRLKLIKAPGDTLFISLDEIKKLPKTDVIFDFKCIEGWSQVTHWSGVKFSDFVKHYGLDAQMALRFTGMETPDGEYYVGLDNKSMLQPQTILCYEMNGAALPLNQGFPLRLIIPVKYGVKHLKRIGTIAFSDDRPRDYWYERGYDYYCGL